MINLVFNTAFIGDVLLSIPLLKNIRMQYPNHKLHLFCREGVRPFFENSGLVDKVIVADKKSRSGWVASLANLRSEKYDIVFCPHESFRSARTVASLSAQLRVGYQRWWNFPFFDKRVERPMALPEALRQMALLAAVNSDFRLKYNKWILTHQALNAGTLETLPISVSTEVPEFLLNLDSRMRKPSHGDIVLGIAPGSVWETKKWPWQRYAQVAGHFLNQKQSVVLLGSTDEKAICEQIEIELGKTVPKDILKQRFQNRSGAGDLLSAYNTIRELDVLISNDSGLMHLAAAAGVATVAIFGPTTLSLGYQPWSENAIVVQKSLSCRPCGVHGHKACPIGTHACMTQIQFQDVISAVQRVLI